ncbi:MAG: formate dehydrogenase accessory sulfurtransferase FdhD [Spirochaetales bacterium]|nr:formate dehydrogenase accessory sulfurtransferase FdhD [Spirochaetales bacterium]
MIISNKEIIRYKNGISEKVTDPVISEEWFNLYLNEKLIYQTPVLDQEINDLIHGLLFVKGHLKTQAALKIRKEGRSWLISSNETFSGQSFRQMVEEAFNSIKEKKILPSTIITRKYKVDTILNLMRDFQKLPSVYHETGGVHMAAFATDKILFWADDVSRRNSVDKVIGKVFLSQTKFQDGIFVSSGRISSDIVIRMIKTGVNLIASVSAPMDKAIELAEYYGITLCGFARGNRMNIYTHPERLHDI